MPDTGHISTTQHAPTECNFVDDTGVMHPPALVCSVCRRGALPLPWEKCEVRHLIAENERLRQELNEAQLRSIEAQNPGITAAPDAHRIVEAAMMRYLKNREFHAAVDRATHIVADDHKADTGERLTTLAMYSARTCAAVALHLNNDG